VGPRQLSWSSLRPALILCLCAGLAAAADRAAAQTKDAAQASSGQSQVSEHIYRSDSGEPISKVQASLDPQDDETQQRVEVPGSFVPARTVPSCFPASRSS
jgi:hypothetical protein